MCAQYGEPPEVLAAMHGRIQRECAYAPLPGATGHADGAQWSLGDGVRIEAQHLPGHTAGQCALIVRSADGGLGRGLANKPGQQQDGGMRPSSA